MNFFQNQQNLLHTIIFFSLAGVIGSLYFTLYGDPIRNLGHGNIFPPNNGYIPCLMCWWQRIFMYPIALIGIVALITKDWNFPRYTLALAMVGIPFSIYHYIIQYFKIDTSSSCAVDNPCSATEVSYLGFITIPLLALAAFMAIAWASYLLLKKK